MKNSVWSVSLLDFARGKKNGYDTYVVVLNLIDSSFVPGKNGYERAKLCLSKLKKMDFLATFASDDEEIISKFKRFLQSLSIDVKICTNRVQICREFTDIKIPAFIGNEESDVSRKIEFDEWLGVAALGSLNRLDNAVSFACSMPAPAPSQVGSMSYVRLTGYISSQTILDILCRIRSLATVKYGRSFTWAAITVHGFDDSPVGWSDKERAFGMNGDNAYRLIVLPDNDYWIFRLLDQFSVI